MVYKPGVPLTWNVLICLSILHKKKPHEKAATMEVTGAEKD